MQRWLPPRCRRLYVTQRGMGIIPRNRGTMYWTNVAFVLDEHTLRDAFRDRLAAAIASGTTYP